MTIDPIVWYITAFTAISLVVAILFRRRAKVKAQESVLWNKIHKVLERINEKREKTQTIWFEYRLIKQKTKQPAERIVQEVEDLETETGDLYEDLERKLFGPIPVLNWSWWVNFFYEEEADIPDRFYDNEAVPKHSVEDLEGILEELKHLDRRLDLYLEKLEYATTAQEHTGLTPIEFRSTMLEGQERAEKRRQEERAMRERYLEAKETLSNALLYLRNRDNRKSVERANEPPTTGGSARLTFDMVQEYWRNSLEEIEEQEKEEGVTEELIQKVLQTAKRLKEFPEKARMVAKTEERYVTARQDLENISKDFDKELAFPEQLEEANKLLNKAPEVWASADWQALKSLLDDAHSELVQVENALERLFRWGRSMDWLGRRMYTIIETQDFLRDAHEVEPRDTKGWNEHEQQEEAILEAWASIDEEAFKKAKKALEATLNLREQMLVNRIGEIITEKSEVLPQEAVNQLRSIQSGLIKKSEDDSSAPREKKKRREDKQDPARDAWAPEPGLSGKLVKVTTETGLVIEVDESMASHYNRRWSAEPQDKEEENENSRPKNTLNGLKRATEEFNRRMEGN